MSGSLISPGVQVQVSTNNAYATSGPGTTPLIVMATAANKFVPGSSTSIASGTIASTAGKMQLMTSQRELLQTYGNPRFYSQAGTPQNGNELNEYGLYSAYQYLGIANTAWVVRANIDLDSLQPSATAPSGKPTNGDYWLDLSKTSFGLFRSDGNLNGNLSWGAVTPLVLSTTNQLEIQVQGVRTAPLTDPNASMISAGGTLYINGISVALSTSMSINQVVNAINTNASLSNKGIRAEIFQRVEIIDVVSLANILGTVSTYTAIPSYPASGGATVGQAYITADTGNTWIWNGSIWENIGNSTITATVYNLRIICSDIYTSINFYHNPAVTTQLLTDLGFDTNTFVDPSYPYNHIVPKESIGSLGDIAVNAVQFLNQNGSETVTTVGLQMFEKIAVTTEDGTFLDWYEIGTTDLSTSTNNQEDFVYAPKTGWGWSEATPTVVTCTVSNATMVSGNTAIIVIGVDNAIFTVNQTTTHGIVADLNNFFYQNNFNAYASIKSTGSKNLIQITNYDGTQIGIMDKTGNSFKNAGFNIGQTFFSSVTGVTPNPSFTGGDSFVITTGNISATIVIPGVGSVPLSTVVSAINSNATIGLTGLIVASISTLNSNQYLTLTSSNGTYFSVSNVTGYSASTGPMAIAGIPTGYTFGRQLIYQSYTFTTPVPSTVDQVTSGNIWINTQSANLGSYYAIKRYNAGTGNWVLQKAPLYINDSSANASFGSNLSIGTLYVMYDGPQIPSTVNIGQSPVWPGITENATLYPTQGTSTATLEVRIWNGNSWQSLYSYINSPNLYTQSSITPTGAPATGTYWYNTNLQADIMVSNGKEWLPYRVAFPNTDVNGVQLSATAPSYQSNGTSPLVDQDLWIDTSDLENYPMIYRWDGINLVWNLIDNTDHVSSRGIVFGDARYNTDGTVTGSSNIVDMLTCTPYVDSDAPSALSYPYGVLLFNTRYSTYNVKEWQPNWLPADSGNTGRWVSASGLQENGAPWMGRKAQRTLIVQAMADVLVSNQDIRSEINYYNLIAAPGYPELISEMINLNVDIQNNAFIVGDTPARLAPNGTSVQNWATNASNAPTDGELGLVSSSPYVGLYYPWGLATNVDGTSIFVPPSCAVLRTIAFNDQISYPWFPPAGYTRGLISVFSSVGYLDTANDDLYTPVTLSQGQRDVLYVNKINPIAYIPGRGLVIMGQVTLDPAGTPMNRVNVTRLVCYLNYNLAIIAKPFLFELNDSQTRSSVTRTFEALLANMVSLRAMYDFAVDCSADNNSPETIDSYELFVDVAIQPEKSIEFIYIPLVLQNTGTPLPQSSQ